MKQNHFGEGDNVAGNKITINNLPPNQPQRDKNQQDLIKYIGEMVDRLLSQSLRNQVYINLDKVEDFSKVTASMQLKFAEQKAQPLPPETTIVQVYDRPDINGRLLILGDPGSGKSTNLYKLVQELVIRAKDDINQPIPILFNLSSWTSNYTTIKDWLIDELNIIGFRKKLAKQYLDDELIIPCLDGLDELQSDRQTACVEAINTFLLPRNWKKPLIVCSRRQEFDLLQKRIDLNGAVILQPLTDAQIQIYLQETKATHIQELIANDEDWQDLAKTPLFLDIMVLTNKTLSLPINQGLTTKKAKLSSLFEAYLNEMLDANFWESQYQKKIENSLIDKQKTLKSYLKKYVRNLSQTRHYLTWLAQKLTNDKQTVFLIEKLQPTDLANPKQKLIYGLMGGLMGGLMEGLMEGLIFGLVGGLIFGLILGRENNSKINTVEQIQWSWINLKEGLIVGLIGGMIGGLNLVLEMGFRLIVGLIGGLIVGLIGGLIYGLIKGLIGSELELGVKKKPNQGIKASINNGILTFSIILSVAGILYGVLIRISPWLNQVDKSLFSSLKGFLFFMTFFSLIFSKGGIAVLQHFCLRLVLTFNGYSPWNYACFLDYCTEQMLLQRIGGGYRFIHRLLQEHLLQTKS